MPYAYIHAHRTYTETPKLDMFNMHTHDDYELYCFLGGSAEYYVEGTVYTLQPGDIILLKRAEAHSLIIDKPLPYERVVINFNSEALIHTLSSELTDFLDNRPLGKHNKYTMPGSESIVYYLEKICQSEHFPQQQLYLTFLLYELKNAAPVPDEIRHNNTQEIIRYINAHLFEPLDLDSIARHFFISKNYLNHLFKKYTGSTIWSYIVTKRLIQAKNLLRNGEKPTTVYAQCGFNDYCSFYRAYKNKYGIPPREECNTHF